MCVFPPCTLTETGEDVWWERTRGSNPIRVSQSHGHLSLHLSVCAFPELCQIPQFFTCSSNPNPSPSDCQNNQEMMAEAKDCVPMIGVGPAQGCPPLFLFGLFMPYFVRIPRSSTEGALSLLGGLLATRDGISRVWPTELMGSG